MSKSLRIGLPLLLVLTEAMAWMYASHVIASSYERAVLRDLASRIGVASAPKTPTPIATVRDGTDSDTAPAPPRQRPTPTDEQTVDAIAGARARDVALEAAERATAGPPWWLLLALSIGAYCLTRFIRSAGLGALGTTLGILVSVAALNVAWRIVLVGDVAFWNASELADYFESASQGFQPIDVVAFTEDPNPGLADPRAAGFGLVVSTAVWIRFLAIGRSPVRWESALRSFSLGFPVVLAATFVGSMNRVPGGAAALAYFTLALLTLAIANAGRAVEQGTRSGVGSRAGLMKSPLAAIRSPWAFASAAAILILFATGATLVAFTSFGAGTAILLVGDLVARVVQSIALLVITPIYWLIQFAADWMNLRLMDLSFMTRALNEARPDVMPSTQHPDGRLFWVGDAFRLAGFALLAYLVYRGARYMFSKLESRRADNAEGDRSTVTSAGGFGALLREAFAGRPHRERDDGGWMRRQPAYWLYGRMVHGAVERRFAPRAGETPLEFAAASQLALDAPVFTSIAREFDRARYGAHYPSEDELRPLAAALRDWETAHPVTDEIRMKPGRDEEAPQIEIERTPDVPEPPPELMPPV